MAQRRTLPLRRSMLPGSHLRDCVLALVEGPDKGLRVRLDRGAIRIGADESCEMVLSDKTISGFHAELSLMPDGVRIRDLGSTNGIMHLGSRVSDSLLQPGAVVQLGRTTLAILPPDEPQVEPIEDRHYGSLLGQSVKMRRVFSVLRRLEQSDATVLLQGETGTGKSTMAAAIHEHSMRAERPMVVVDCGAISPALLHSELFGHRRGAFTGAQSDRLGAFQVADGGSLLLDEVGELPLALQPILLRAIETGEISRVGETRHRRVDVRIIAATNRPLDLCVAEKTFRADLFYRLSVVRITIPPLRECPEDIMPLARRLLDDSGHADVELPPEMVASLQSYSWPGNVRQLCNAVERLVAIGIFDPDGRVSLTSHSDATLDFHQAKAMMVEQFERVYLAELLRQYKGNLSAASRGSGVARNHLRALLTRHGLRAEDYR